MPGDPLQEKYPIQCIGHHYKQRTHSSYGNVAWLKEAHPQKVWINELDARARGIKARGQGQGLQRPRRGDPAGLRDAPDRARGRLGAPGRLVRPARRPGAWTSADR